MIHRAYLFDWGDTIMRDIPGRTGPMKDWPQVYAIEGVERLLQRLSQVSRCYLATNAKDSFETDIRAALERAGLNRYFTGIFCFRSVGYAKPSTEFFSHIVAALDLEPEQIAMVGDSFENDILGAVKFGIYGYWFNPRAAENKRGDRYTTIHAMSELLELSEKQS